MSENLDRDWALVDRARRLREQGNDSGAIEIYSQLLGKYAVSELYNERGVAYSSCGEYQKAIIDFTDAVGLTARDPDYYVNRANAYLRLQNYDAALDDYNRALELNPQHVHARHGRAYIWGKKGQADEAIRDFNRAIELSPAYASHDLI